MLTRNVLSVFNYVRSLRPWWYSVHYFNTYVDFENHALMMRLLEFACSQVPLFIQESKRCPKVVFIIGAAGKSPSTLSISVQERAHLHLANPFFIFSGTFVSTSQFIFVLLLGNQVFDPNIKWWGGVGAYISVHPQVNHMLCFSLTSYIRLV